MHADEVHAPDADGSHGGGGEREEENVLETLVGGTLAEHEEGGVGAERRDGDGGDDDARVEALWDAVRDIVLCDGGEVCSREKTWVSSEPGIGRQCRQEMRLRLTGRVDAGGKDGFVVEAARHEVVKAVHGGGEGAGCSAGRASLLEALLMRLAGSAAVGVAPSSSARAMAER